MVERAEAGEEIVDFYEGRYAEMLLSRNAAGDRERATELLDEALRIARRGILSA